MSSLTQRIFKVFPGNLTMPESGTFSQKWSYGATHPIRAMMDPIYFQSLFHQIRPADTIRIHQMESLDVFDVANRVLAYIDVVVVASSKDGIVFHMETDTPVFMPTEDDEQSNEANPQTAAKYVKGKVKWAGPKAQWRVMDADNEDHVLVSGIESKEVAEKMANGEIPIPD